MNGQMVIPAGTKTLKRAPLTRSQTMARVRSRDTAPEVVVRRLLTAMGHRYRLHRKDLPGTPDIAFIGRRKVIFVHGCFWHGHDCARGSRVPKANRSYWLVKIARNRARDEHTAAALAERGWRSLTVWECELRDPIALKLCLATFLDDVASNSGSFDVRPVDEAGRT